VIEAQEIMDLLVAVRPGGVVVQDYPALCEFIAAGLNLREEPPAEATPTPVALQPRGPGGKFVKASA
jgi:hypothetical protein